MATYAAIISGRVQRSVAALVGAVSMVAAGLYFGFYTQSEVVVEAIDWNTIGLLLGMMLMVGVLEDTGMFEALAVWVVKISGGRYLYMIMLFGFLTAFASTTIDNVTTLLLVAPISLSICANLGIDPKPILLTEALFSDVGGVATLVGDPPNVMISGAAGFSYMDFVLNLAPVVIICTIASLVAFRLLFSDKAEKEDRKMKEKRESSGSLLKRSPSDEVKNWDLLWKSLSVLFFVVALFVVHHEIGLKPATVALIGSAVLLMLTRPEMEQLVARVKWTTLLFFAGLFVVVYGISPGGTNLLGEAASRMMNLAGGSIILSCLAILFITAFGSAIVDNIPFTAVMIPVVATMSDQLPAESGILWWALAFGAGFGANGTYVGSSANVVAVKISEDYGEPISFGYWLKYGSIIMFITVGIAALALVAQIVTPYHIPLLPG